MSDDETAAHSASRRDVVKALAGGAAVVTLAPGLVLMAFGGEARTAAAASGGEGVAVPTRRWGLLIDVSRCAEGCSRCVDACSSENGWSAAPTDGAHRGEHDGDPGPQWLRIVDASDDETGRRLRLPLMCQHCASPPCADVCPTRATFRRADGIVLVDRHRCIGCRYCVMACPFNARFFLGEDVSDQRPYMPRGKGTAEACTLCVHRIDEGRLPACVEACGGGEGATAALVFGDLNDPASPVRKHLERQPARRLRDDLALGNGIQYQGV